jgi:hypothetical protein
LTKIIKRCNYPNPLTANKKALQNARLFLSAPLIGGMLQPFSLVELAKIRKLKG